MTPEIANAIAEGVADFVRKSLEPLKARLDALERQQRSGYRGAWDATESYGVGDQCTHSGSLWIATEQNAGVKPGGGKGWKLAVKRGKAA